MANASRPHAAVNELGREISKLIAARGPITVDRFMSEALYHPEHGYYMRRDPLGAGGDFITAPEISQMFGELIGIFCAESWQRMGSPPVCNLVELGPGRGTLMQDALRAGKALPGFTDAVRVHLVEISPVLKARQCETLRGRNVTWMSRLDELPEGPTLLIANEFFDALPIRQFVRANGRWRERLVAVAPAGDFEFRISPEPATLAELPGGEHPDGCTFETSNAARHLAQWIGGRLRTSGGVALAIDYGTGASAFGDSLQAVRGHKSRYVLEAPGENDLTAHVDFSALAAAAARSGVNVFGPIPQGTWLERMGIALRAKNLKAGTTPDQAVEIDQALHRLTAPSAMGVLFRAMAFAHPGLGAPAGFAT
jgi:NADH dehydrogenase [ubiquinone] 1 alpha subcomplex assembly factor 7